MDHTRFLVDLDGRLVAIDTNDFTNELFMSYFDLFQLVRRYFPSQGPRAALSTRFRGAYQLIHSNTNHILGDNDGAEKW